MKIAVDLENGAQKGWLECIVLVIRVYFFPLTSLLYSEWSMANPFGENILIRLPPIFSGLEICDSSGLLVNRHGEQS